VLDEKETIMAQTQSAVPQQIVKEGKLLARQGAVWDPGLAVLTADYFYFRGRGASWLHLFGLLGGLLRMALPVKVKISLPLTSITALGRGKIGLVRDVFFVEAAEGKKYWFRPDYQPWLEALTSALQNRSGVSLTRKDGDRWEVAQR
jgi:hypothetical protein